MKEKNLVRQSVPCFLGSILLLMFWGSNLNAGEISSEFLSSDFGASLQIQNGTASFTAERFVSTVGNPRLPEYIATYILPDAADLNTVEVVVEDSSYIPTGAAYVAPVTPETEITLPEWEAYEDWKNPAIYETNAFVYAAPIGSFSAGQMRSVKVLRVPVYPYNHNPVSKEIKQLSSISLTIRYSNLPNMSDSQVSLPASTTVDTVLNIQSLRAANAGTIVFKKQDLRFAILPGTYPTTPKVAFSSASYVILTTNDIVAGSTILPKFIKSKQSQGYRVTVVTETQTQGDILNTSSGWGGGTGQPTAHAIRAWLQNHFETLPIDYLLLIGDPSPETGNVPMLAAWINRFASGDVYWPSYPDFDDIHRYVPTDAYFADMNNDWNAATPNGTKDNYYGHGGSSICSDIVLMKDKELDIKVGRIPTYYEPNNADTYSILDKILSRTIWYENIKYFDNAWKKNILVNMRHLGSGKFTHQIGENIREILDNNNYQSWIDSPESPYYFRNYTNYDPTTCDRDCFNGNYLLDCSNEGTDSKAPTDESDMTDGELHSHCPCGDINSLEWRNLDVGFIFDSSHGSRTSTENLTQGNTVNNADFIMTKQNRPVIVFEGACLSAWPDRGTFCRV